MTKCLVIILIISVIISVFKIALLLVVDLIDNHTLSEREKCKYLLNKDDDYICSNIFGKFFYKKKSVCKRNKCPSCTKIKSYKINELIDDNSILNILFKISDILVEISASLLIIINIMK